MFIDLQDLCEKIDIEFDALLKEETKHNESDPKGSEVASAVTAIPGPSVVDPGNAQPYAIPDNYGRSDLNPFSNDPLRVGGSRIGGVGGGGMIFDPFRGHNYPQVPGNLPPGAVPPGARFDPFGPLVPDDITGLGARPMRGGLV